MGVGQLPDPVVEVNMTVDLGKYDTLNVNFTRRRLMRDQHQGVVRAADDESGHWREQAAQEFGYKTEDAVELVETVAAAVRTALGG